MSSSDEDPKKHKKRPLLRRDSISPDDPEEVFEMIDIIGEGAYGLICTCKNVNQNKIYAIKFLEIDEEDEENLQKEIDILKESLSCPHIVQYYGCYLKDNTLMIVMEFCDGGSALDLMNSIKKTFTEDQIASLCAQMIQGLAYLHSHKILHRDINAGDVLLTSEGRAKLADFGVSAKLVHTHQRQHTMVGSPYWMAPEVISQKKKEGYDMKTDIWSLGITAIELAEGKPPLFDIASLRVIFLIPARDPPVLKEATKWSPEFHKFLATCLQKDPDKRPSATDLLNDPFIQRGLEKENDPTILRDLVIASLPLLKEARDRKKDKQKRPGNTKSSGSDDSETSDDDDNNNSLRPGTIITVNTTSGEWSRTGNSYGTTVINRDDEDSEEGNQYDTVRVNAEASDD